MKPDLKNAFIVITTLTLLSACAGAPAPGEKPINNPVVQLEQEINDLMAQVGEHSVQKHRFERISHCRYEISTQWRNLEKGYYSAKTSQRFSFTHDLRNIENTPAHSLKYKDGMQYWDEMLDLTFNRMVPTRFSYIKTDDYQLKHRNSESDAFSISGYESAPRPVMNQLQDAFERLAQQCGADIGQYDDINQKLIGRWEVFGLERPEGALIITPTEAGLLGPDNLRIEGSYSLAPQNDFTLLTINAKDGDQSFNVLFDFVNSNYARVLLLGDKSGPVPFAPVWSDDESAQNADEKKLFRKGDLR